MKMNSQVLVLDTTYVLPLFGILPTLGNGFIEELKNMWENGLSGIEILLPDICLLEVLYKLNGEYRKKNDLEILERYTITLPSIKHSQTVKIVDTYKDENITILANKIRTAGHTDFFDCLIGASAINLEGILITEDQPLKDKIRLIYDDKENKMFSWKEFSHSRKKEKK